MILFYRAARKRWVLTLTALLAVFSAVSILSAQEGASGTMNTAGNTKKLCALTFDDGPSVTQTSLVLDRLEKYNVVATFFVIGQKINDGTKSVLERAVRLGCEIENHSWAYDSLDRRPAESIADSIDRTSAAIEKYAGRKPRFFRPPNLAVSDTMYVTIGLPFISGVLGMDWPGMTMTAEGRANHVLSGVRDGAVILLHDVQPEPHPTPEALDIIIPELLEQEYEFVTVSELFRRKNVTPETNHKKMWVFVE